jgi:DNA-directed RNA polymerase specialized sigma24 family protein
MPKDLTSESFAKLLRTLSSDEAEAAGLYTKLHRSLVRFFQLKGISEPDKAADETLDRVAEKINREEAVEDVIKYTFGVAKFVSLEKLRREQIGLRAVDGFYLKTSSYQKLGDRDEFEPLRACFEKLSKPERDLLVSYFADLSAEELFDNRQKLAETEKVSLNTLRIRVSRIRKRLEDCLKSIF